MTEPARVCLVSQRRINRLAAWCSNYEFEDTIQAVDDVDVLELTPGRWHAPREWVARRMMWRRGLQQLTPHFSPGLERVKLTRDYDLFVYVCMNPWDLIYLGAIDGWKDRCAKKICFMAEFYAGWTQEFDFHLKLLRGFDHVALPFAGSVDAVGRATGRPCHHVPLGVDVRRFTPDPRPPDRTIDVYSMGRRDETAHRALLQKAGRGDLFYVYDTIPGTLIQPRNHHEHRDLIANIAKRSRMFVTFPAKVGHHDETRGQSEVGARFFEGAAAGAIMIGQAPTAAAFRRDFDWADPVIDLGASGERLDDVLTHFRRDPDHAAAISRRNALEAIRRFDWSARWEQMLDLVTLPPSPRLARRRASLDDLASAAQAHSPVSSEQVPTLQ